MDFHVVIDVSSLIWNIDEFKVNAAPYYDLANEWISFIEIFEKEEPAILLRTELLNEIFLGFPFEQIEGNRHFNEFSTIVLSFLSNISDTIIEFDDNKLEGITSIPNIIFNYYTKSTKEELEYLISEIHSRTEKIVYLCFNSTWSNDNYLKTIQYTTEKKHKTIIYSSTNRNLSDFFYSNKRIFEFNTKHHKRKKIRKKKEKDNCKIISQLKCYNGSDILKPQYLLDIAIKESKGNSKKMYSYDIDNNTFVCFIPHRENKYHGFDIPIEVVPDEIKNLFLK